MKDNVLYVVKYLYEQSSFVSSSNIAQSLSVSPRSVKNYITDINQKYPDSIVSSRKGYKINKDSATIILDNLNSSVQKTSKQRVDYLISCIINSVNELNIYDLCDELSVSYSTLKNEFREVKNKLEKYDLTLINKRDNYSILGLERNKRRLLSVMLYNEINVNFLDLESIETIFPNIDIVFIKKLLLDTFDVYYYYYYVNDYSFINIILHIAIAIDRIIQNNISVDVAPQNIPSIEVNDKNYKLSKEIATKIENKFNIKYSEVEVYELTILLISRTTTIDYKTITRKNIDKFIGRDCLTLVNELIISISQYYYINLCEEEFFIRFAIHVKNLIQRSKNNRLSKNPLTEEIKKSCPLIYDVSVHLSGIIQDKMDIVINDDEIAYIAFHLGSALEFQKKINDKVLVVLYCTNYYDTNTRLASIINKKFEDDLLITSIVTDISYFDKSRYDFILSTVPIKISNLDNVNITHFLNDNDIEKIKEKISEIKISKRKNKFRYYLNKVITPSLFEKNDSLKNEDEAIKYMSNKMFDLGYVSDRFESEIYSRERISSTAFLDFAIPHSVKMNAYKTGINVIVSEKPISWWGQQVHIVLMMSFNISERYIFNEVFEPITMILTDKQVMNQIIKMSNYEEFINFLVDAL